MRPHQSGNSDANQYTPVFHGLSGWQLYHGDGYGAPVEYQPDRWIKVRIVVARKNAEVYIDNMRRPAVVIHELKRDPQIGALGLSSGGGAAKEVGWNKKTVVDSIWELFRS